MSGPTWDLPDTWAWTTLETIADTTSGGTPRRDRPEYYGGSIPWLKSGELNDGAIVAVEESITEAVLQSSSAKMFPAGTLCIALYGATVGKLGLLKLAASTNQAVCGISSRAGVNPHFLFRFLQYKRPELVAASQGGAQPNISHAPPYTDGVPRLPEGWTWASVEQVSSVAQYGSSAKCAEAGEVPVLRMGNLSRDGAIDAARLKFLPSRHPEFPELLLSEGDLLFNRTNSAELVGKSAVYRGTPSPCSFASYLIRIRTIMGCDSRYVAACLNSSYGREWIKAVVNQQVGQANVNGTKLQAFVFPLPPAPEQSRIVEETERVLSTSQVAEQAIESNQKRATRLRQSILKRAFEGKLVSQNPNDEPAAVLLGRIRAEREAASIERKPIHHSKQRSARVGAGGSK